VHSGRFYRVVAGAKKIAAHGRGRATEAKTGVRVLGKKVGLTFPYLSPRGGCIIRL
jgi:hypothetical protein